MTKPGRGRAVRVWDLSPGEPVPGLLDPAARRARRSATDTASSLKLSRPASGTAGPLVILGQRALRAPQLAMIRTTVANRRSARSVPQGGPALALQNGRFCRVNCRYARSRSPFLGRRHSIYGVSCIPRAAVQVDQIDSFAYVPAAALRKIAISTTGHGRGSVVWRSGWMRLTPCRGLPGRSCG
jgi:hypothetical protein